MYVYICDRSYAIVQPIRNHLDVANPIRTLMLMGKHTLAILTVTRLTSQHLRQ